MESITLILIRTGSQHIVSTANFAQVKSTLLKHMRKVHTIRFLCMKFRVHDLESIVLYSKTKLGNGWALSYTNQIGLHHPGGKGLLSSDGLRVTRPQGNSQKGKVPSTEETEATAVDISPFYRDLTRLEQLDLETWLGANRGVRETDTSHRKARIRWAMPSGGVIAQMPCTCIIHCMNRDAVGSSQ